jgi:NAD(P)-dependent dehydrogenase (short-subunit alcohol dehydrogenase family)
LTLDILAPPNRQWENLVDLLEGKVAVVTGAGRGIGREEALLLGRLGAHVVVNDRGVEWDGTSMDDRPATLVAAEIRDAGGVAAANFSDIATPDGARELVDQAIREFGDLDILVNNAGILRDGMIFSVDPLAWKAVVDVHLYGHFLTTRWASEHWRARAKQAPGDPSPRSVVFTSSESGLFGNAGQSNYDVAKMGIASLTIAAAKELRKYGVTCNAIAPRARTRMTTSTFENSARSAEFAAKDAGFDPMDPANVAPFVAYLAGPDACDVTGQVFIVYGGAVARVRLPHVESTILKEGRWTVDELAVSARELFSTLPPDHFEGPKGYARLPRQTPSTNNGAEIR